MDDLNRPLGVKPEPAARAWGTGPVWLGAGAVAILLVVAGFFAWNQFSPPAEPPFPQIVFVPSPAPLRDSAEEPVTPEPRRAPVENPDGAGMVEMEPDGTITVPEVRPEPSPRARPQEAGLAHLPDPDLSEKGATGIIPRISPDGRRPMDVYAREPDTTGNFGVARVVLIVGGIGISQTSSMEAIRALPSSVVLAFAPYGNSLGRWLQEARRKGHEVLLQVPMEPHDYPRVNPGPHTLRSGVSVEENIANLHWLMSRITNYVGVMNYLGGKLMTDDGSLGPVFDELAGRGLLFVDDGSAGVTRTRPAATASLLPFAEAGFQLDTVRTRQAISERLEALAVQAKRSGMAIGVATAFPESIAMISQFVASAASRGIEITPVSAVVSDPEHKR